MDETRHIYGNSKAGAIGAVFMYVLLSCALAALFCWRVASTAPKTAANDGTRQTENLTTEKK